MEEKTFFKTPRGKALIQLLLWGFFLCAIYFLASASKPISVNKEEQKDVSDVKQFSLYSDMQKNLLKNNYSFKYKIKIQDKEYVYEGIRNQEKILGIKQTNDGEMVKYFVSDNLAYKVVIEEITLIEDLYLGINEDIIHLDRFFDSLKGVNYTVNKEDDIRIIQYETNNYSVVVTTDTENILKIDVKYALEEYSLMFHDIGKIKEVSY